MEWIHWSTLAHEFAAWMADVSLRDVALALLALLLIPFVRRSSTTQHATWAVVLVGMLALPLLRPVVPATHLHLPQVLAQRV
ncbi:MAG: hypothetical protein JOZ32_11340, partial [Bryobacterales bacterium]|nr:hypothetical protein [Bryobacterales bacterium]